MAEIFSHSVEGLKELETAMLELTHVTARGQGRKALKSGGQILADRMLELAPKDKGHLADSIAVGTKLTKRQKRQHKKQSDVEVFVGPNDPAAVPQEFGWEGNPPQPFARPAWDETHMQVLDEIARSLAVNVDKSVARARRKAMNNGS